MKVKDNIIEKAEGGALLQLIDFDISLHLIKAGFIWEQFRTFCPDCGFRLYDYDSYTELKECGEFHCNSCDCESIHSLEELKVEVFYTKNF